MTLAFMAKVSLIENISEKERKATQKRRDTRYIRVIASRSSQWAIGECVNIYIFTKTYSPPRKDPLPDIAELP